MTDEEKEKLLEIRALAGALARNSDNEVNALAALIMELAKSHQYCDVRYMQEKLNLIFSEERVKWHSEYVGDE